MNNSSLKTRFRFNFEPVEKAQRILIHRWVAQDYIRCWLHGQGLRNALEDLEKSFKDPDLKRHWIGYDEGTPFAYLIAERVGKNVALDLFICEPDYLGKGLSVQLIHEFLLSKFPQAEKALIEPETGNERAVHVYQKAGFEIIEEFMASWLPTPHYRMELNMSNLRANYDLE